jgi:hypothetical protein
MKFFFYHAYCFENRELYRRTDGQMEWNWKESVNRSLRVYYLCGKLSGGEGRTSRVVMEYRKEISSGFSGVFLSSVLTCCVYSRQY